MNASNLLEAPVAPTAFVSDGHQRRTEAASADSPTPSCAAQIISEATTITGEHRHVVSRRVLLWQAEYHTSCSQAQVSLTVFSTRETRAFVDHFNVFFDPETTNVAMAISRQAGKLIDATNLSPLADPSHPRRARVN